MQVHIFFVRKFFPASARNLLLLQRILENYKDLPEADAGHQGEGSEAEASTQPVVVVEVESASHNDLAHSDIVEEQESLAES